MDSKDFFSIKTFYDYLEKGRLMGTKCLDCKNLMIPPRLICIECRKTNLERFEFKGNGTLKTFTVLYVAPTPLKEKAPYILGIVN